MSSAVWRDKASERATCNTCGKEYVCKGGTTSNLINHLKSKHKELHEQYLEETTAKSTTAGNVVGLDSFKRLMEIANRRIKLKHPNTYSKMVKVKADGIRQDLSLLLFFIIHS